MRLVCPEQIYETLLDKIVEVVSRMAHWDDGLMDMLLALPGARRVEGHRLSPAVSLAPDDLVIGVQDGALLVAELSGLELQPASETIDGGATLVAEPTGATVTWPRVVRDPAAVRAGVAALRAVVLSARPYR